MHYFQYALRRKFWQRWISLDSHNVQYGHSFSDDSWQGKKGRFYSHQPYLKLHKQAQICSTWFPDHSCLKHSSYEWKGLVIDFLSRKSRGTWYSNLPFELSQLHVSLYLRAPWSILLNSIPQDATVCMSRLPSDVIQSRGGTSILVESRPFR